MFSMLIYLFALFSFTLAGYDLKVKQRSRMSQEDLESLIERNFKNKIMKDLGLRIRGQEQPASRNGLSCPIDWNLFCTADGDGEALNVQNNCTCIQYLDALASYSTAESFCRSLGGALVSIQSELKNKYLYVFPKDFEDEETPYVAPWIGLKRVNGTYEWADGKNLDFTSWNNDREPTEADKGCIHFVNHIGNLDFNGHFKWGGDNCDSRRTIICEMAASSSTSTTPATESTIPTTNSASTTVALETEASTAIPITSTAEPKPSCPMNYTEKCFQDSPCYCYGLKSSMYWGNGIAACNVDGANIVSIHSQDENDFVRGLAEENTWIGTLYDSSNWVDGTEVEFKNWESTYSGYTVGYINFENKMWRAVTSLSIRLPVVCKISKQ